MAPRALVFDLDGTLLDSYRLYAAVIESAGGPASAVTQTLLLNGEFAATLLGQVGINGQNFQAAVVKEISVLKFYPSVESGLSQLRSDGMPMGIVTRLPQWIWEPLVEITQLRDVIPTIEGYRRGFPKAAGIKSVLSALSVPNGREVWYVGDLQSDGSAAETSGVSFAWASWGYSQMEPTQADLTLKSFREVLSL